MQAGLHRVSWLVEEEEEEEGGVWERALVRGDHTKVMGQN
jgi:hypothetical protein